MIALGLIETIGYTTAVSAADAAVKAASVEIIGIEKVIGVEGYVGVTIHLTGDVAAVTSAVEAGKEKAEMVGQVVSTQVIPRVHSDVNKSILSKFLLKEEPESKESAPEKIEAKQKDSEEKVKTTKAVKGSTTKSKGASATKKESKG